MSKRPSKPTNLKVLEGNRGKRPLPEDEPKPLPKAPKILPDIDDNAKKIWKRLAPKLERLGLLTELDGDNFAILCQIRSRLETIHKFIREENKSLVQITERPDIDSGTRKEIKPSPYVVMEKQYYELFRKFSKEFGLSPVGRVGLTVGSGKDKGDDLV